MRQGPGDEAGAGGKVASGGGMRQGPGGKVGAGGRRRAEGG